MHIDPSVCRSGKEGVICWGSKGGTSVGCSFGVGFVCDDIVDVDRDFPQSIFGVFGYFDYFLSVFVMDCCVMLCEYDCGTLGSEVMCGEEGPADVRGSKIVGCDREFSNRVRRGVDGGGALAIWLYYFYALCK